MLWPESTVSHTVYLNVLIPGSVFFLVVCTYSLCRITFARLTLFLFSFYFMSRSHSVLLLQPCTFINSQVFCDSCNSLGSGTCASVQTGTSVAAVVRRSVGFWGGEIKESVGLWLLGMRTLYWLLPLLDCLLGSSVRVSRLHAG